MLNRAYLVRVLKTSKQQSPKVSSTFLQPLG